MQALIVVDAQNEFSPSGQRAVPNHASALAAIAQWVAYAREERWAIAWVQHHNKPHESPAFVPGTWGAELSEGLAPDLASTREKLFQKDVFGAFTGTGLEAWLHEHDATHVHVVGFFAHMCVSTTVREALVRGFEVSVDPQATGARDIDHPVLGRQPADEVRRTAMLQLTHMDATIRELPARVGGEVAATR